MQWLIDLGYAVFALLLLMGLPPVRRWLEARTDPLKEAEVYLCYGRKAQAIELLEAAALKHPQRGDIAEKLRQLKGQQ
jgi:Tfp pilus assembly protein FimV